MKKHFRNLSVLFLALAAAGCATTSGRNYQADIDALNAKLAQLQGQLSEKDSEIARLQNQMRDEETARSQAETERRRLADEMDALRLSLEAARKPARSAMDSDLK